MRIADVEGLTTQQVNALARAGIDSTVEAKARSEHELLLLPRVGWRVLSKLRQAGVTFTPCGCGKCPA